MALYLKYRPKEFDEVYGNEQTLETLQELLTKPNPPHSYLLHGPTGCGKTTLARIIARKLGCEGNDFRELDTADFRGIDTIREIREHMQYRPLQGKCRVWLLDEVHQVTREGQNALLKALEDTPHHVYFILCTTDLHKLLPTIRGRCSEFSVKPLSDRNMKSLLHKVVKAEGERLNKKVYDQIIQDSQGHPRNALQILEQALAVPPEKRLEVAKRVAEKQSQTIQLCRALLDGSPWSKVMQILKGLKEEDPEGVRRAVLGYCQAVLLNGENNQAGVVMEEFIEPFYNSGFAGLVFACYSVVMGGEG